MKKIFAYFLLLFQMGIYTSEAVGSVKISTDELSSQIMQKNSLNENDINIYRQIFSAIRQNDIDQADELMAKLGGNALMGHVLAQKYLSAKYISSYQELQNWLKKYSHLPQKNAIAALAVTKAPGYKKTKSKPTVKKLYAPYAWYKDSYSQLKPEDRKFVKQKVLEFLQAIRRTDNKKAEEIMHNTRFRMTIPDKRYDGMSSNLAASYFYDGDYEKALQWTSKAVKRSHDATAAWFGGLAAWKLGDYQKSASLFAKVKDDDLWLNAAAAYWAYRAYNKLNKHDKADEFLRKAAKYKHTFYGILAKVQLGENIEYNWERQAYLNDLSTSEYYSELLKSPTIMRAILLLQVGEYELAENDLRKNYRRLNAKQKELVMFISDQYSLANMSFVLANNLKNHEKDREYDNFLYPDPDWKPADGWRVNRSWILALIRQESLFMPQIKSHAGACGLMQLMPATAAMVAKNKEYKKGCKHLFDKARNMEIGQQYVEMLLEDKSIEDNIFFLAAAYNGGPHNVKKWVEKHNYDNDPLMFVEMIPWRETRLYAKKVAANYWIYNSRRGKNSQSLRQLKQGKWPQLD